MGRREHFDAGHDPNAVVRRHMQEDPTWPHYNEGTSEQAWKVIDTPAQEVFEQHKQYPLDCGEERTRWAIAVSV